MNWTRISLHALFWLVYLPINAALSCVIRGRTLEEEFRVALIGEAYSLPVKMLFVYFIFYYVIPLYHAKTQWIAHWSTIEGPAKPPLWGFVLDTWWAT